jgi:hypothetical protein
MAIWSQALPIPNLAGSPGGDVAGPYPKTDEEAARVDGGGEAARKPGGRHTINLGMLRSVLLWVPDGCMPCSHVAHYQRQ